jgi:hypothetical protein
MTVGLGETEFADSIAKTRLALSASFFKSRESQL